MKKNKTNLCAGFSYLLPFLFPFYILFSKKHRDRFLKLIAVQAVFLHFIALLIALGYIFAVTGNIDQNIRIAFDMLLFAFIILLLYFSIHAFTYHYIIIKFLSPFFEKVLNIFLKKL
jgi:hypothetical protein